MAAGDDAAGGGEPLKFDSLQRDILNPQIRAFLDATTDPAARGPDAYALTLRASGRQVVIRFDQTGVRFERLRAGLD